MIRTIFIAYRKDDFDLARDRFGEDDLILTVGWRLASKGSLRVEEIILEPPVHAPDLVVDYLTSMRSCPYPWRSYLNRLYSSAVGPLVSALHQINQLVSDAGEVKVVELGRSSIQLFPFVWTGWGESARGLWVDPSMLVSASLGQLLQNREGVIFKQARSATLGTLVLKLRSCFLMLVVLLKKLVVWRPRQGKLPKTVPKAVVMVRSEHQLRAAVSFAKGVGFESDDLLLVLDEMIAGRNLKSSVSKSGFRHLDLATGLHSLSDVMVAVFKCFGLLSRSSGLGSLTVDIADDCRVQLDLGSLLLDVASQPAVPLHAMQVRRLLRKVKSAYLETPLLVGFEQVSPQAFILGVEGKKAGLSAILVKSAAISNRTYPTVGTIDRFLVETSGEANVLTSSAIEGKERIRVARVFDRPERVVRAGGSKRILYIGQPHDRSTSLGIVKALASLVKPGIEVTVRPHPREVSPAEYGAYAPLDTHRDLLEAISVCDLVVSRTSSVLTDALGVGVPAVAVTLTDQDRCFFESLELDPAVVQVKSADAELSNAIENALRMEAIVRPAELEAETLNWDKLTCLLDLNAN